MHSHQEGGTQRADRHPALGARGELGLRFTAGGAAKRCSRFGKQSGTIGKAGLVHALPPTSATLRFVPKRKEGKCPQKDKSSFIPHTQELSLLKHPHMAAQITNCDVSAEMLLSREDDGNILQSTRCGKLIHYVERKKSDRKTTHRVIPFIEVQGPANPTTQRRSEHGGCHPRGGPAAPCWS